MLVTFAFYHKDQDQAERLANWIEEIHAGKGHEILIGVDRTAGNSLTVIECLKRAFDKVHVLPINNPYDTWPSAPNHCFSDLARYIEAKELAKYFLYLEPDAVPLEEHAFAILEAEFLQNKKPFMGMSVRGINGSPDHMSGIGVYQNPLVVHAGLALIANDVPFDLAGASQIVPLAHFTKLIYHKWKGLRFESIEELRGMIGPEPVLYHACKTGQVIDLLRAKMNLSGGVESRFSRDDFNATKGHANGIGIDSTQADVTTVAVSGSSAPPAQNNAGSQCRDAREQEGTPAVSEGGSSPRLAPFTPWADKAESIAEIRRLAQSLKQFCNAPRNVQVLREILKEEGVIKKVR